MNTEQEFTQNDEVSDGETLEVDNNEKIKATTQFRRRGFAPPPPDTEGDDPPTEEASAEEESAEGTETEEQGEEESSELAADSGGKKKQKTKVTEEGERYKILDKTFATREEAFSYAEELAQAQIAADAFRQGVEAAARPAESNPQAEAPQEEEIDPRFYSEPAKYLKERDAQVIAQAKKAVRDEDAATEKHNQTWTSFYKDYPDLQKAQPLVQHVLNQHWETLKHVETKKALKIVADAARKMKKEMLLDELPQTALPNKKLTASPGGGVRVTTPPREEKELNFTEQMQKNRASRLGL